MQLERQARAGGSVLLLPQWKLAADVDLTTNRGTFGDVRELAFGTEGQLTRRLAARAGAPIQHDRRPRALAGSLGRRQLRGVRGSMLVDGQITAGSDNAFRGWGLAGRFVF